MQIRRSKKRRCDGVTYVVVENLQILRRKPTIHIQTY